MHRTNGEISVVACISLRLSFIYNYFVMDVARGLMHPHYVLEFIKVLFLKEHVRGPVRECQTIILDILRDMRCEELECTRLDTAIYSKLSKAPECR